MQHKIMVVDDDPHVIESLGAILREEDFEVISTGDGSTVLTQAQLESPSLIILDLMLPQMPGLEICKALKQNPMTQDIPIIMLTGKTKEGDKICGLEAGADDYVTKPFNPRELVLRINRSLGIQAPI
jgi:two-component system, OmpR family, phosphate regulon response regulator PhoB